MGGSAGHEVGARSQLAMTRCASRKLRKSAASSMSCRESRGRGLGLGLGLGSVVRVRVRVTVRVRVRVRFSCRKRRRKRRRGSELHAMASVTAVKIQWSSPSGERRSLSLPD